MSVPLLYSTEKIPLLEKIAYEHWVFTPCNFHWLLAEVNPKERIAFGWAYLNDEMNAEWGFISLSELEKIGAKKDASFSPKKASEAIKQILEAR